MLSEAKHLAADRDRPFAALMVTEGDCSNGQGQFVQIEPCLRYREAVELCSLYFLSSTPGAGSYEWIKVGLQLHFVTFVTNIVNGLPVLSSKSAFEKDEVIGEANELATLTARDLEIALNLLVTL
jgi:hypothetical protein